MPTPYHEADVLYPPRPSPSSDASNSSKWGPYSGAGEFSASMLVILAGLFCAFLIAGSLGAAVHFLLCGHRRGRQPASHDDGDPEKQEDEAATTVSAVGVLVFSATGGGGGSAGGGAKQQQLAGSGAECAICLTEFVDGDAVGVLPACSHGFHVRCVERWLAGRSSCPTCRAHCDVGRWRPPREGTEGVN